jgi:DnaK suppressor protein
MANVKMSTIIRRQLQTLEHDLSDRLTRIRKDRMRMTAPLSADFSEQAVERENDEVLDRLEQAADSDLNQVQHALKRAAEGLYGHCDRCGAHINTDRLRAVPHTTTCGRCATAQDRTTH